LCRCGEWSNELPALSPFPSSGDYITNTSGYDFRKGHVYHIPFEVYAQTVEILKTSNQANQQREISLILPNGERFARTGKIVTGSNEFNRDTQMIDILAEFSNPTYLLRPELNVAVQTRILPK